MTSPDGLNPGAALGNDMAFATWQHLDQAAVMNQMRAPVIVSAQSVEDTVNGEIKTPLTDAQQVGVDNSKDIATLVTNNSSTESGNSSAPFNEGFDWPLPTTPTADWAVINPCGVLWGVTGSQFRLTSTGGSTGKGSVLAIHTTGSGGDNFDETIVLGDQGSNSADSGIIFRADGNTEASLFKFGYVNIYKNSLFLGYGTRTPGLTGPTAEYTAHDFPGATKTGLSLTTGTRIRVTGIGNSYVVYINSAPVINYTDNTGLAGLPLFTGGRYQGVKARYNADVAFFYKSFSIAGFSFADITAPTYVGTGWHLYRANNSTGNTAITASAAGTVCPAGTFNGTNVAAGSVTVLDQSGQVQVAKAGWYHVCFGATFTAGLTSEIALALFKGGGLLRYGSLQEVAVDTYHYAESWVVYLAAGEVVRPAIKNDGTGSVTLQFDAPGLLTYFSGALISS